jgi:hypothetical protein
MVTLKQRLSAAESTYLKMGLCQPGGKLPLFDNNGQEINTRTISACLEKGYVKHWFANPLKPEWLVCRLTAMGREALRV